MRSSSPATGVIWALRAQSPKKVRKWVPGASRAWGSKKSRKRVKNSQFWTPFSTGPGNPFSDFSWTLGPKGPNDPCSRRRRSQVYGHNPTPEKTLLRVGGVYPLTRNYYENNSLRIIFRNFEAISYPQNLRERRTFSRNYA